LVIALTVMLGATEVSTRDRFDTVVIDPGHGGQDAGARGPGGALEKDLVLGASVDLAKRLRARGLRVVMTRVDDVFVPLERRTAIANDARGDLFLSIHANATEDTDVGGSETYFLALDASDAGAAEVAARENRAFAVAEEADIDAVRDPFIALLGDLIATEYLRESSEAARLIQTELASVGALRSRGVKQALFVVLAGVQMPAALVEIGFVTNAQDERTLTNVRGSRRLVDALERAVMAFADRYDERRGASTPAKTDRP
jgi:N-acetylmuramoyl-L-alanine amidase